MPWGNIDHRQFAYGRLRTVNFTRSVSLHRRHHGDELALSCAASVEAQKWRNSSRGVFTKASRSHMHAATIPKAGRQAR